MDRFGQLITIDLMLALIIITLIIGISANAMDIVGNRIQFYSSEHSMQRIVEDAANILIKTPGNPEHWEGYGEVNDITPGLAELSDDNGKLNSNMLSREKIFSLKQNPKLMDKLFPSYMGASLVIYPCNSSLPTIVIMNKTHTNPTYVYSVNRTVLYNYGRVSPYLTIRPNNSLDNGYICAHSFLTFDKHQRPNFNKKISGWICLPLNVRQKDIHSTDFYILTDPPNIKDNSAVWLMDRSDNITENIRRFEASPVLVTPVISGLLKNDSNDVIILHVFMSGDVNKLFNAYLVGVPK